MATTSSPNDRIDSLLPPGAVDTVPYPWLLVDHSGTIRFANKAAAAFFAGERDTFPGHPLTVLFPMLDWSEVARDAERHPKGDLHKATRTLSGAPGPDAELTIAPLRSVDQTAFGLTVRPCTTAAETVRSFLQNLIDALPCPVFYKDSDAIYLGCNDAFTRFLGKPRDQIVGKDVYGLSPKDLADVYHLRDTELFAKGPAGTQIYEARVQPADGERRDVVFYKANFTGTDGQVAGMIGAILDVTPQKQAERRLHDAIESINEGFALYSDGDRLLLHNSRFQELFSPWLDGEQLLGMPYEAILHRLVYGGAIGGIKNRGDAERWLTRRLEAHGDASPRPTVQQLSDGRWIEVREQPTAEGGIVGVLSDVTELKQQEKALRETMERVRFLAMNDPLSGLPNRVAFHERLDEVETRARREQSGIALLYIDLNGFKQINDEFGHHAGDACLRIVGRRLLAHVRESDAVARLGGDEFAVIIRAELGVIRQEADSVAERLLKALSEPAEILGSSVDLGASVGIALYPEHSRDTEELLHHADLAMYEAKSQPASCHRFFQGPRSRSA